MLTSRRASLWLAACLICVFLSGADVLPAKQSRVAGNRLQISPELVSLVDKLDSWLDRESHYPRRPEAATVRLFDPKDVNPATYLSGVEGSKLRGYYVPSSSTIWLVRPWSADNPRDVSVLLHELVHHRQQVLKLWQCPNAQELSAYKLQDRWLAERGLHARVNWLAVLIGSSCHAATVNAD